MKKLITVVLSAALILSVFTGCGGNDDTASGGSVGSEIMSMADNTMSRADNTADDTADGIVGDENGTDDSADGIIGDNSSAVTSDTVSQ